MPKNNNEGSTVRGFDCFNINWYARFKSERGLRPHLWQSSSCKDYMARQQAACDACVDSCQEIDSTTPFSCYGVESTRLNPGMSTDPPLHTPYEGFGSERMMTMAMMKDASSTMKCLMPVWKKSPITTTLFPVIDSSASPWWCYNTMLASMYCWASEDSWRHPVSLLHVAERSYQLLRAEHGTQLLELPHPPPSQRARLIGWTSIRIQIWRRRISYHSCSISMSLKGYNTEEHGSYISSTGTFNDVTSMHGQNFIPIHWMVIFASL